MKQKIAKRKKITFRLNNVVAYMLLKFLDHAIQIDWFNYCN